MMASLSVSRPRRPLRIGSRPVMPAALGLSALLSSLLVLSSLSSAQASSCGFLLGSDVTSLPVSSSSPNSSASFILAVHYRTQSALLVSTDAFILATVVVPAGNDSFVSTDQPEDDSASSVLSAFASPPAETLLLAYTPASAQLWALCSWYDVNGTGLCYFNVSLSARAADSSAVSYSSYSFTNAPPVMSFALPVVPYSTSTPLYSSLLTSGQCGYIAIPNPSFPLNLTLVTQGGGLNLSVSTNVAPFDLLFSSAANSSSAVQQAILSSQARAGRAAAATVGACQQ